MSVEPQDWQRVGNMRANRAKCRCAVRFCSTHYGTASRGDSLNRQHHGDRDRPQRNTKPSSHHDNNTQTKTAATMTAITKNGTAQMERAHGENYATARPRALLLHAAMRKQLPRPGTGQSAQTARVPSRRHAAICHFAGAPQSPKACHMTSPRSLQRARNQQTGQGHDSTRIS